MKTVKSALALLLMLCLALTAAPAMHPALAEPPQDPPAQIEIGYTYCAELITALYHLYGGALDSFVDITLTNNGDEPASLLVETRIEGYTTTSSSTVLVPPHTQVKIAQNPRLVKEAIDALNARCPGNFIIKVTRLQAGEDDILLHESHEINLYSRRDMVWLSGCSKQEVVEYYAAWVTPNDPAVEELIRRAADYTDSGIIKNGYEGLLNDEEGGVWDRLQAIWRAEEEYDLIYVSTMVSFGENWSQRVRTPYEVLDQSSGNCIETSCLFASAVEALDMEAALVFIPGHAYVGVRTDRENANYYFIETTLIGRAGFSDAVDAGAENWEETQPHLDAGDDGYAWVNIYEAREKGILPMPWR